MNENLGIKWIKQLIEADPTTNEDAVREAKKGIQDYLAASFFANREAIPKQINNGQPSTYCTSNSPIDKKQRIIFASRHRALVNGFRGHYLDIDDTQPSMRGHASAVILSALFAVAHPNDDGQDVISAYIAGVEIGGRLGNLFNPDLYQKGWHATEFIGGFAATAALIKYLNLNESEATNAFSLVASQASGKEASYLAEIFRAALDSVDSGQIEVGLSVGMKPWKIYQTVVIPQAVVNAVPGTLNVFISLVKESSIVFTLGVTEVFASAKLIASSSMLYFETYVVVGFIYWVLIVIISWLQGKLERKIAVPYKRS